MACCPKLTVTLPPTLLGRLLALARADQRLTERGRTSVSLCELIHQESESFGGRIKFHGDDLALDAAAARNVALAFHELATNAVKYGALSVSAGEVNLSWTITRDAAGKRLKLLWRECGGPPVRSPQREGFGTTLLKNLGEAHLEHAPDGVICEIHMSIVEAASIAHQHVRLGPHKGTSAPGRRSRRPSLGRNVLSGTG
jgi:two-component sensor histidine kinase